MRQAPGRGRGSPRPRRRRCCAQRAMQRGLPVDHAVEDGPRLVVAGVAGCGAALRRTPGCRGRSRSWPWSCLLSCRVADLRSRHASQSPGPQGSPNGAGDPIGLRLRTLSVSGRRPDSAASRPPSAPTSPKPPTSAAPRSVGGCSSASSASAPSASCSAPGPRTGSSASVGPLISKDGTGLASLLPIGRFRIYTVTGDLPSRSRADWSLKVGGLVDHPFELSYDDLVAMPATNLTRDFQCVTGWRVPDVEWKGVQLSRRARPRRRAAGGDRAALPLVRRRVHREPHARAGAARRRDRRLRASRATRCPTCTAARCASTSRRCTATSR